MRAAAGTAVGAKLLLVTDRFTPLPSLASLLEMSIDTVSIAYHEKNACYCETRSVRF